MRITRIRTKNFRALGDVDLTLPPFSVLVGPNGSGKSSVLELLHLFAGIGTPGNFSSSFSRWGGFDATLFYGAQDAVMSLGITATEEDTCWDYDVQFCGERGSFYVSTERFSENRLGSLEPPILMRNDSIVTLASKKTRGTDGTVHGSELELFQRREQLPEVEGVIAAFKRIALWQAHKFSPSDRVRAPQQLQPTVVPAPDGGDLFSSLYAMRSERRPAYHNLIETLKRAVPELEELEFPLAGAGHVNLTWKQANYSRELYSNQLSDGTLRLLWMMTILHTAPDDGMVLLDEPELSLHPQWLALLVSVLRKMSLRTTILVATQSAELLKWLQPEELIVTDLRDNGAAFTRAVDKSDLRKWLDDFTLSELWTMGELGGRR